MLLFRMLPLILYHGTKEELERMERVGPEDPVAPAFCTVRLADDVRVLLPTT